LVYGQLGLTCAFNGRKDEGLEFLEKCKNMSRQINNLRLNLDSIICISKIRSKKQQEQVNDSQELFEEAFDYAKTLGDHKYAMNCLCNLGIMEGGREFEMFATNFVIPGTNPNEVYQENDTLRESQSKVHVRAGHGNSQMSEDNANPN